MSVCPQSRGDFDDLCTWWVFLRMILQVLIPFRKLIREMGVGVVTTEHTKAMVTHAPRPVALQFPAYQVGSLVGTGEVPEQVQAEQSERVGEGGSNDPLIALRVAQHQRGDHLVDVRHRDQWTWEARISASKRSR